MQDLEQEQKDVETATRAATLHGALDIINEDGTSYTKDDPSTSDDESDSDFIDLAADEPTITQPKDDVSEGGRARRLRWTFTHRPTAP